MHWRPRLAASADAVGGSNSKGVTVTVREAADLDRARSARRRLGPVRRVGRVRRRHGVASDGASAVPPRVVKPTEAEASPAVAVPMPGAPGAVTGVMTETVLSGSLARR